MNWLESGLELVVRMSAVETAARVLNVIVGLEHVWIMSLETILWRTKVRDMEENQTRVQLSA